MVSIKFQFFFEKSQKLTLFWPKNWHFSRFSRRDFRCDNFRGKFIAAHPDDPIALVFGICALRHLLQIYFFYQSYQIKYNSLQDYWGVDEINCYDPAYFLYQKLPQKQYDSVVVTDVLEHCHQEDVKWIIDEIFGLTTKFVFANIACYLAQKSFQNGKNVHSTIVLRTGFTKPWGFISFCSKSGTFHLNTNVPQTNISISLIFV